MVGWILGEATADILEQFRLADLARGKENEVNSNCYDAETLSCEKCGSEKFDEHTDRVTCSKVCTQCGNIQFGEAYAPSLFNLRIHGKTVYDPCERFRYWIDLSQGKVKLPPDLIEKLEKISTLSDLKHFLSLKQNRKYRKFYGCILKSWDEDLIENLNNTEIESLLLNFTHLLQFHSKQRGKNPKTGRKKSLPHYVFLITTFLKKIGRDDLASNFFPMRCKKIEKEYEEIINHLF